MNGIGHSWSGLLRSYDVADETATRLIRALVATEVSALAFCRLLDRWARGEPDPTTPGRREAALRRAAERVETALAGLERPLGQYLLELQGTAPRAAPGTASPERGRCSSGTTCCAGPASRLAEPRRPGLPRAGRARPGAPGALELRRAWARRRPRAALWAGLFDLRENLYGGAVDDLRALAA